MASSPRLTFNFIGVAVQDWQPAFDFFHHRLGLNAELNADYGDWANLGGGWDAYYSGRHSAIFELFDNGRAVTARHWGTQQGIRPAFHVSDVEQALATLDRHSIPHSTITEQDYGRTVEFTTPEAIRFALAEIPGQPTGDDFVVPYIGHVAIKTADDDAMQYFYSEIIGYMPHVHDDGSVVLSQSDDHPLIILESGGTPSHFDVSQTHWADDPVRAFPVFMSFMTPNARAVYAHLQSHGVTMLREIVSHDDWGGTDFHIADPDGNGIQIVQYH